MENRRVSPVVEYPPDLFGCGGAGVGATWKQREDEADFIGSLKAILCAHENDMEGRRRKGNGQAE